MSIRSDLTQGHSPNVCWRVCDGQVGGTDQWERALARPRAEPGMDISFETSLVGSRGWPVSSL